MKRFRRSFALFATAALVSTARAGEVPSAPQLRLELNLVDSSCIIGTPSIDSVPVQTSYAKMDVPLEQILTVAIEKDHETAFVDLQNGDKLKGVVSLDPIKLETVFGKVSVGIEHIRDFRVMLTGRALPPGEGPLAFGGVNWVPWRTLFEVQGDKLVTLPKARPGFNYGHGGSGRGATLMTNIGSAEWRDYSVEFEFCMSGVNPAFNPHGLPLDYRGGCIMFHVADGKESWNERGGSCYVFNPDPSGAWSLRCVYNDYCAVPRGFGNSRRDAERALANGKGLKIDSERGNTFRIDVCGPRIQIWADGEKIVDMRDEKMGECIGGKTLDHGGIGFHWGMDSMGWIRNFSAKAL